MNEEYILSANYLVVQCLVTHAGGRALLCNHKLPLEDGLEKAATLAMEAIRFHINI
jgi:hypothetical protein